MPVLLCRELFLAQQQTYVQPNVKRVTLNEQGITSQF